MDPIDEPSFLAVFAHPDDESLSVGGLLARTADSGARATVVTATWASGTDRERELADALAILGAGRPRMLGYADARVAESAPGCQRLIDAPLEESVGRLVAYLRELRPDVVVTHDAFGGLTGHPDHLRTHRITVLAARASGSDQLYRDAGEPWRPRTVLLATHPRSALPVIRALVGERRAVHTVDDEDVTTVVDVRPWLDRKVAAVRAHQSEVRRGALPGVVAGMTPAEREQLLGTEWFSAIDLT